MLKSVAFDGDHRESRRIKQKSKNDGSYACKEYKVIIKSKVIDPFIL
jgi:hypothetical protein